MLILLGIVVVKHDKKLKVILRVDVAINFVSQEEVTLLLFLALFISFNIRNEKIWGLSFLYRFIFGSLTFKLFSLYFLEF